MLIRMKLTKLTKNSRMVHFQLESKNSPTNIFLELSSHLGSNVRLIIRNHGIRLENIFLAILINFWSK